MAPAPLTLLPLRAADAPKGPNSPPFSGLLQIISLLLTLGNIPYWIVEYIFTRPAKSLDAFLFAKFFKTMTLMYPFLPGTEGEGEAARLPTLAFGGFTKDPWDKVTRTVVSTHSCPVEWRTAYATEVPGVRAVERPGFILTPPGARAKAAELAVEGERIIMYIHGGAYIRGHPLYTPLAGKLARDTSLRVFGVQYRKCLDDASAFPAPLLDTLAAWRYLTTTLGFAPSNILVTGESAGGHLTLALVQQLSALDLPLPGAIAICSPWVDMTMSLPSWQRNKNDILCKPVLELAVRSATRHYDESTKAGWFSPAFAPKGHWSFLAAVPAFVSVGTAEAFEDEIEKLAEGMRGDGVDVTLWRDVNGIHAAPLLPLQPAGTYERWRDGIADLLAQMDIKAGGDGGR